MGNNSSNSSRRLQLRSVRLCSMAGPLCLCPPPHPLLCPFCIVSTRFVHVHVQSNCTTTAELLLPQILSKNCPHGHAMPYQSCPCRGWMRGKWEYIADCPPPRKCHLGNMSCNSMRQTACPGIVYHADGSRLLPGPPMQPHPQSANPQSQAADPRCNVQGARCACPPVRCEWQVFVSSPFLPTALRETE